MAPTWAVPGLFYNVASVLLEFEVLLAETCKFSRGLCHQFPGCCSENPPSCIEILINT